MEAFNTQFRLRLIAALKKELKRLTGSPEGMASISTARLGEEEGVTHVLAEGADEGGRAARKSEKVGRRGFCLNKGPALSRVVGVKGRMSHPISHLISSPAPCLTLSGCTSWLTSSKVGGFLTGLCHQKHVPVAKLHWTSQARTLKVADLSSQVLCLNLLCIWWLGVGVLKHCWVWSGGGG